MGAGRKAEVLFSFAFLPRSVVKEIIDSYYYVRRKNNDYFLKYFLFKNILK
jgi:hypothetical protein